MIVLRKLTGKEISINPDLIESIEASPDTVVTLVTGNRYVVKDSVDEVIDKVVAFRQKIMSEMGRPGQGWMALKKEASKEMFGKGA
ncbi:MAG: flagellar FlbD family protein [Elusimicrobia bacterium]|nr:flagellar FlbD family protein [Elusimicrobiota bacterium]